MAILILVGAEGVSELEGMPWIRPATPEEHDRWHNENPRCESIDGIGRPYFLMAVLDAAPDFVQERARSYLRVKRLVE